MRQELESSAIAPDIIARHFRTLGPEAWEYLFNGEFPNSERRNDGRLRNKWMRNYAHLDNGGWWCSGYDPLTGGDMDWGTFKPNTPRQVQDGDRTKTIKYEHPPKQRTRAFFLHTATYWERVKADPSIPIVITEGAKKAAAVQSQDIPAIGLPGIFSGYRSKDAHGNPIEPVLIPELEAFAQPGREFVFFFDQDAKPKTRRAVATAIANTGRLLMAQGCKVKVATWQASQGKGVDDLIATKGAGEFDAAVQAAAPFALYRARRAVHHPLGLHRPDMVVNVPCLSAIAPESIPSHGTIVIDSPMGTGKTKLIGALLDADPNIGAIAPGNTIGLQRGLSHRLGMAYIDDCDSAAGRLIVPPGFPLHRVGLCWDSTFKIPLGDFPAGSYNLIFDEIDQGLRHLLRGATCGKDGKRPGLMQRAVQLIRGARRVICASATLSRWDIDLIASLRGEVPWILKNTYQRDRFPVTLHTGGDRSDDQGAVLQRVQTALMAGKRVMMMTDTRTDAKALEVWARSLGIESALSFHADNSGDDEQRRFAANPDQYLAARPVQFLVASPSLTSGVSITGDHFDLVVGMFYGQSITPSDAIQQLGRYRRPVQRVVWCAAKGRGGGDKWAEGYRQTDAKRAAMVQALSGQSIPTLDNADPIATYLAESGAAVNLEMGDFGAFFQARLEAAGHPIAIGSPSDGAAAAYKSFQAAKTEAKSQEYRDRHTAPPCEDTEAKKLKDTTVLSYRERCKLERWMMQQFYVKDYDSLTLDDVERDRGGKYQRDITRLECLLYQDLAGVKDDAALKELTKWNAPILSHDLPTHRLKSEGAIALGLPDLVQRCMVESWHNATPWAIDFVEFAKARCNDIKTFLGFNIHPSATPCQVIGMILRSLGIKTTSTRLTNADGDRYRDYALNAADVEVLKGILQRRHQRHTESGLQLRPHPLTSLFLEGVDTSHLSPPPPPRWQGAARQNAHPTPPPMQAIT
jgi:hypothetical protein